jgi:predicted DNA binding CopG/RHH family protein
LLAVVSKPHLPAQWSGISHLIEKLFKELKRPQWLRFSHLPNNPFLSIIFQLTIRLYDHDFKGIQKKALQMGIPYQTLISGVIHRYIEGDLISKEG